MNKRLIFPLLMFTLAACSFAWGGYQYWYAGQVQAASDARVAHIMDAVADTPMTLRTQENLYASIYEDYPAGPAGIGVDVSGSLAGQKIPDGCASDGQRSVCRSMRDGGSSFESYRAACGVCLPQ